MQQHAAGRCCSETTCLQMSYSLARSPLRLPGSADIFVVSSQILEKNKAGPVTCKSVAGGCGHLVFTSGLSMCFGSLNPLGRPFCPVPGPSRDCECLCRDALTVFTQFHSTASIQTRLLFGLRLNVCSWACLCQVATHCLEGGSRHQNCG